MYEKMILECDAKDITFSEFIERKIAAAGAVKKFKEEIAHRIESAYEIIDSSPTFAKKSFEVYWEILIYNKHQRSRK